MQSEPLKKYVTVEAKSKSHKLKNEEYATEELNSLILQSTINVNIK